MGWGDSLAFRDCPWCGLRDAQMRLLQSDMPASRPGSAPRHFSVVACPRCAGVTVLETNGPGQNPAAVLSAIPADSRTAAEVRYLPPDVKGFYDAAQRVLEAGVPDAAAVELRKTLEAAAARFKSADGEFINNGPLVQRIQKLIAEGYVTKQFGEVLDRVRQVGNVGAHASDETVDQETAEQVLRFTTQVLRNLFEIPGELDVAGIMAELRAAEEPPEG
jgi:hypothetical protein